MTDELMAALSRIYDHYAHDEFRHEAEMKLNDEDASNHIASAIRVIGLAIGRTDQEYEE